MYIFHKYLYSQRNLPQCLCLWRICLISYCHKINIKLSVCRIKNICANKPEIWWVCETLLMANYINRIKIIYKYKMQQSSGIAFVRKYLCLYTSTTTEELSSTSLPSPTCSHNYDEYLYINWLQHNSQQKKTMTSFLLWDRLFNEAVKAS